MQSTGSKRCSSDQGGLEIPAKTVFQNSNEGIIEEMKTKLAPLIEDYNTLIPIRGRNQIL